MTSGTLIANAQTTGTTGVLGAENTTGRSVIINLGSDAVVGHEHNVFWNGSARGASNIPTLVINGGTVTTASFNGIGSVQLNNGATLTNTGTGGGGTSSMRSSVVPR